MREFKLRARRGDFCVGSGEINLFAFQRDEKQLYVAKKLELQQQDKQLAPIEPFLHIDSHEAQQLMDDLWDCGLRPSEGSGSAGQLRATQEHLSDMKTIAFHSLKICEEKK